MKKTGLHQRWSLQKRPWPRKWSKPIKMSVAIKISQTDVKEGTLKHGQRGTSGL